MYYSSDKQQAASDKPQARKARSQQLGVARHIAEKGRKRSSTQARKA